MKAFDKYPEGGRKLIGSVSGSNCRHEYCLDFMRKTGQKECAYCGLDFTASYETWLAIALDHVVPRGFCERRRIKLAWSEDASNKVLACAACNSFHNRYTPSAKWSKPKSLDEFYDLRDAVFEERKKLISQKHEEERDFFRSKPWLY